MNKFALTTAAFLIATGSAFAAGSGQSIKAPGNDINQSAVDTTTTSSIVKDFVDGGSASGQQDQNQAGQSAVHQGDYGQGIWGHQ